MKIKKTVFLPIIILIFLVVCLFTIWHIKESYLYFNLSFKHIKNPQYIVNWLMATNEPNRIVLEINDKNITEIRLYYSKDKYKLLLNKCIEKFQLPYLEERSKKIAIWRFDTPQNIMRIMLNYDENNNETFISIATPFP